MTVRADRDRSVFLQRPLAVGMLATQAMLMLLNCWRGLERIFTEATRKE